MPTEIGPGVLFFTRKEWGADESLPRLGTPVAPTDRIEAILHHYAALDTTPFDDDTPNIWESFGECAVAMRGLQTARAADLGADIPYSDVAFLMAASFERARLLLMEGRGFHRRGAHTKYHNRTGYAIALAANTQNAVRVDLYTDELSSCYARAKGELPNLGTVTPERGGEIHGHRDFRREDDRTTWTVCPGRYAMQAIDQITIGGDPLAGLADEFRQMFRELERKIDRQGDKLERINKRTKAIDEFVVKLAKYNFDVNRLQQDWLEEHAERHAATTPDEVATRDMNILAIVRERAALVEPEVPELIEDED